MERSVETQNEQMKQQIAAGFSRAAASYDHVGPPVFAYFGQQLVELTQLSQNVRVLDVATGRGAIFFPAAQQSEGQIVGIDLSEQMVQETRQEMQRRGIQNGELYVMDAEKLKFTNGSFDVVFCGFVLFFLPCLDHALTEYYRALKKSGCIAISTWGRDDPRWSWYGELLGNYHVSSDAVPWVKFQAPKDEDALRRVLTQVGFQQIHSIVKEKEFVYADEEEWWAVQWSHGMRHVLETLSPPELVNFKADAFSSMQSMKQPDGFHQFYSALFTFGVKLLD